MKFRNILLAAGLLLSGTVHAGQYSDDLAKCLVGKSTMDDHIVLVQWMFAAMSRHPSVATLATVPDDKMDKANQQMAALFTKLLTVTCKDEAKLALKNEGSMAFQKGFQALGEEAGKELFINQQVMQGMAGMTKYFDKKTLSELQSP
ncbi:hypothetical protein [Dyella flagellata]|uniref:Uncharacterized protein n=1 Tax=Dyella flagellata TaxID=1867833 RepID=A0ABQ5X9I9_9GAMM|nr:hypothetical protein [Dyella flagellata]GLQ87319.1 hypothetical protein GCM10007898_08850 [Dyella flagellata]